MPEPTQTNPAPTSAPPATVSPFGTAFETALKAAYPDGVIPSTQPQGNVVVPAAPAPAPAPVPPTPAPAPAPAPTDPPTPGVTGPTGPAATGPTETGPAQTGVSGPTGHTGPATQDQLDKAAASMPIQAGTAFKIIRAENAALAKQVEAEREKREVIEKKLADVSLDSEEVATLKEKVANYEKSLSVVNLEATEDYKLTIAQPMQAVEASLSKLAAKYEVPASELTTALSEPDEGKRSDMLSELSVKFNRLDTAAFDRATTELLALNQARADAHANADRRLEQSRMKQARSAQDSAKNFQKDWETAREQALTDLTKDTTVVGVLFAPTGEAEFDAKITEAIDQVKSLDITRLPNQQIAGELFKARILPLAAQMIADQFTKIEVLTEELKTLRGGTPPMGAGQTPDPTRPTPAPATFAEAARLAMAGAVPR